MAFVSDLSAEMRDLSTPIVIGCKGEVAERVLALVSLFDTWIAYWIRIGVFDYVLGVLPL